MMFLLISTCRASDGEIWLSWTSGLRGPTWTVMRGTDMGWCCKLARKRSWVSFIYRFRAIVAASKIWHESCVDGKWAQMQPSDTSVHWLGPSLKRSRKPMCEGVGHFRICKPSWGPRAQTNREDGTNEGNVSLRVTWDQVHNWCRSDLNMIVVATMSITAGRWMFVAMGLWMASIGNLSLVISLQWLPLRFHYHLNIFACWSITTFGLRIIYYHRMGITKLSASLLITKHHPAGRAVCDEFSLSIYVEWWWEFSNV